MRDIDLALAGLGVVVAALTAFAVLAPDQAQGRHQVSFVAGHAVLPAQGPRDVAPGGLRLDWTAPENATGARFLVSIDFHGQAVQGGEAVVAFQVVGPDGVVQPPVERTLKIDAGATRSQASYRVEANWAEVPESQSTRGDESFELSWVRPIQIRISVAPPSDAPVAHYSFSATAQGEAETFAQQTR